MGLKKTASLAKTLYYWKNMSKEIEQLIDGCEKCQVHARFQRKESLKQTFAEGPMNMNSADIAQYGNKTYLVHADRYSNFLWVYHLKTTTTKSVIDAMWNTFYLMGFPDRLRTDNGPQLSVKSSLTNAMSSTLNRNGLTRITQPRMDMRREWSVWQKP